MLGWQTAGSRGTAPSVGAGVGGEAPGKFWQKLICFEALRVILAMKYIIGVIHLIKIKTNKATLLQ